MLQAVTILIFNHLPKTGAFCNGRSSSIKPKILGNTPTNTALWQFYQTCFLLLQVLQNKKNSSKTQCGKGFQHVTVPSIYPVYCYKAVTNCYKLLQNCYKPIVTATTAGLSHFVTVKQYFLSY